MTIDDNQPTSSTLTTASTTAPSCSLPLSHLSSSLPPYNTCDSEQMQASKEALKAQETLQKLDTNSEIKQIETQKLKIQQQREARRRRILDNAKSRLERLNGLNLPTLAATSSDINSFNEDHKQNFFGSNQYWIKDERCSDPEVEPNQPIYINHHVNEYDIMSEHNQSVGMSNFIEILSRTQLFGPSSTIQKSHLSNYNSGGSKIIHNTYLFSLLIYYRLHMMISAVLSLIVMTAWLPILHVLLPVGLCVIVDLLFFYEQKDMNPLINSLLIMLGLRTRWINMFYQFFSILCNIIIDFSVFFLTLVALSWTLTIFSKERYGDLIRIP